MKSFEFYNPVKVVFGAGKTAEIGNEAKGYGKKALLVSYRQHDFMNTLLERVTHLLETAGVEVVPFFEVVANPVMRDVENGVARCKEQGVELVIAVGGGSVMDSAKIIAAGVRYNGPIWNMFNSRHDEQSHADAPTEALPLVMLPTLPATSSEMNCGAVVTKEDTAEKSYVFAPCLYSKVSILDPELLVTLPAYQTACGVTDSIAHILEIYLNNTVNNPVQFRMMEGIAQTLFEIGPQVIADPKNVELRAIQQWACCLGWNGWTMPGMDGFFPMHAIGHSLSALYGTAHGHTLAIMMPSFMRYIAETAPDQILKVAENMMGYIPADGGAYERALKAIDHFEQWLNKIGLKTRMAQLDIPECDLPAIQENATRIFSDKDGIIHAIKPVTRTDVLQILQTAY